MKYLITPLLAALALALALQASAATDLQCSATSLSDLGKPLVYAEDEKDKKKKESEEEPDCE